MESEDTTQIANAVRDVIKSCVLSRGFKVDELATFDIEYLFLNIRGKSVGEEVEVLITCPDDRTTKVPATISLDEIEVQFDKSYSRDIRLDDKLVLRMRYPSMDEFVKNNFELNDVTVDDTFNIVSSCIEQIFNEEESWSAKDCTKKELKEFIESLSSKQFKEIEIFLRYNAKTFTYNHCEKSKHWCWRVLLFLRDYQLFSREYETIPILSHTSELILL